MNDRETDETRDFWNRVAEDWQLQVDKQLGEHNQTSNP